MLNQHDGEFSDTRSARSDCIGSADWRFRIGVYGRGVPLCDHPVHEFRGPQLGNGGRIFPVPNNRQSL